MRPVLAVVPLHWSCTGETVSWRLVVQTSEKLVCLQEFGVLVDGVEPSNLLSVRVEHDLVSASHIDSDAVIGIAIAGVEIENEDQASSLVDNHFVPFVLEGDIRLGRVQPTILVFALVHQSVEMVEILVSQQWVVRQVQLPSSIPERVAVSLTWEIEPLGVPKLIALKVEIALAA